MNSKYDKILSICINAQDLTPAEASAAPSLSFHGTDPGSFYTVILSDPDAPSPAAPSMREWLHWLVIDCRGGDVPSGRVLVPYQGPAPPRGRHRYVTSIFEQPGEGAAGLPSSDSDSRAQALAGSRGKFSTAGFAAQHQLGTAKAAAFFYSSTQE